jgi:hypothetical protein
MSSPCRFAVITISNCIKPVTKWPGGTTWISKRWRSPRAFGKKVAQRHFRLRLKHLDSKRPRIHPRRPSIKKRANYRTNQIDAIGPTEVKKMAPRIRNKRWSTWMAESLEYPFSGKEPATLYRRSESSNYWNFVRCLLYDRDWYGGGQKLSC